MLEGSRGPRPYSLLRPPHHQVPRRVSRSPLARRVIGGASEGRRRTGRLEEPDGRSRGSQPCSRSSRGGDRGEGEKGERGQREEERKEKEKEEAKEEPRAKIKERGVKRRRIKEEEKGYGEGPCQYIQFNEQLFNGGVQGDPTRSVIPGVGSGPACSHQEKAAATSSTPGQTIPPPEGREQIWVVGGRGRLGPEGGSDLRRIPENQRDRPTVSRCLDVTSDRTDARASGTGGGARSAAGGPLEPHLTQILQTNIIPQDVGANVQGSPDVVDNRRSIIEGHDPGRDGHSHTEIEVARSAGLRPSLDVRPADGTLAPRRGKPFVEAGAFDSSSRASRRSEGPPGRNMEGLEQRKGRQSRKRRWRKRKGKERKGQTKEGLETDYGMMDDSNISSINPGRECPDSGKADTQRGQSLEAQGRTTDSTEVALGGRGDDPGKYSDLNDEVIGARLKRLTIDLAGALASGRCATTRGSDPVGAEVEDGPFPPLPPGISPDAPPASDPHGATDRALSGGMDIPGQSPVRRREAGKGLCGKRLWEMGEDLTESFRRVSSLCSQTTARGEVPKPLGTRDTFPLPTFRTQIASALEPVEPWVISWVQAICMSLNSLWGCPAASLQDGQSDLVHGMVSEVRTRILRSFARDATRLGGIDEVTEDFEWSSFFRTRTIDYKGDEVKTAQQFTWKNIKPAIPREIGVVELKDICEQGCKHYIEHFPDFLKPSHEWGQVRRAKVADRDWTEVASGLLEAGIFGVVPESEVFRVHGKPLLNGLFGVEKHEEVEGAPVYRLIMNLVPLNALCQGLHGDITTLPHWFGMTPFHIEPHESVVVSSEDLRCFFYTLRLPSCWYPYLCFNKRLPPELVPQRLRGQPCYPCSMVLPMGFLNSVGIAQHVHRVLAMRSQAHNKVRNTVSHEIRKDRILPDGSTVWRVYLDNYDLLEKYPHEVLGGLCGEDAPEVLALRQEYQAWGLPRHPGKAVSRKTVAEVQGAVLDGVRGIAYPKGQKLSKYVTIAYQLMSETHCSQRQMQVVCGGLVYFSTFRRQLLGGLNLCWAFIESFNSCGRHKQLIPNGVKLEITRFLCLVPLCRMDFRLEITRRSLAATRHNMEEEFALQPVSQITGKRWPWGKNAERWWLAVDPEF